jgi:GNAT superfamily N-acetyltransferase
VFATTGARFVRNAAYPSIRDANHIDNVTAASADEVAALLERAEREFADYPHLRFDIDARTPPEFEARLRLDERYTCSEALVMVLEGDLPGSSSSYEVRHVGSDEDWAAFGALFALDWTEDIADGQAPLRDPAAWQAMATTMRRKSPPLRYWLGCIDGVPRGYLSSWEGAAGIGQVETLFVQPEFRHRGLATALLHHCVQDARVHGAGPVVIAAAADGTPRQMYTAMGWRPVAVKREYLLVRAEVSAS